MPLFKRNDTTLYYETHGSGRSLVLAHGAGGNHLSWWQQVPEFAKSFNVITFDHRGFGLSNDISGRGPAAFVEDLAALLDHLGVEKTSLIGQSMGGWTAFGFAASHPERTAALVLSDTTAGIETGQTARTHAEMRKRIDGSVEATLAGAYSITFQERAPELAFLYRQISWLNTRIHPNLLSLLFDLKHDIRPLTEHNIPTLLIVGEEDANVPPQTMASMAEIMPRAQLQTVPGAGHSVYFERPQEFNDLVIEFITHRSSQ
jgi:3-oxoadipate enol-lactonase